MSVSNGPFIPRNGLVLAWDAADKNSYPGSGTTIYDISGNGNNGTLYNGVGFSNVNGGVLTFDGIDDYVLSTTPDLTITSNTVLGAARYSGGIRNRIINGTANNWLMGHWTNSTLNYFAMGWVSSAQSGPDDTSWRVYAATGDTSLDLWSLYANNSVVVGPNNQGVAGPYGISVGAGGSGTAEFSTAHFSYVYVYNRVLTSAEIEQVYSSTKTRFGL